jgi:hypothetical protein
MKEFSDYQLANITEPVKQQINNLELQIEKEVGHQVVLIAYQEKNA